MAEVVRFSSPAAREEVAARWLARVDRGLSADEDSELRAWLAADSSNRAAFVALAELWDETEVLAELADLFPLNRVAPRRRAWHPFRPAWVVAAAAFVLLAAGGFAAYRAAMPPAEQSADRQAFAASYQTAVGEQATESLSDGSVIRLNTDTRVEVELSDTGRIVRLRRGEAFFDVAHDTERPFEVHAGGGIVQALGTAFNVRLGANGDVEVAVTSGRVSVEPSSASRQSGAARAPGVAAARPDPPRTLSEGEVGTFEPDPPDGDARLQVARFEPVDLDIKLAWQRGMLIFRGEPLEAMLEEAGRYTTVRFEIADRDIADVRVGGYFRAGDVEGLLTALRENFRIEADRVNGERIVLRAAR